MWRGAAAFRGQVRRFSLEAVVCGANRTLLVWYAVADSDCVFCGIVAGVEPASVVHADDEVMAFCDIAPVNPGHVLVVPCRHATYLEDLAEPTGARMFEVAHRLARGLRRSGLRCEGVNLFLADGAAAFQEVFHVHLHVIPRWRGDGMRLRARHGSPDREQLDRTAAALRRGMEQVPVEQAPGGLRPLRTVDGTAIAR